jgi:hypothetical protein
MEEFITAYGFNFLQFQSLIIQSKAIIAGSAPLSLYLKQNSVEPDFEPTNLDIFVDEINARELVSFILSNNYTVVRHNNTHEEMKMIDTCITFKLDKAVKVIVLQNVGFVLDYILCNFDLSICASWWDATENTFKTLCPSDTLLKEMYLIDTTLIYKQLDKTLSMDHRVRMVKYEERGFDLFSAPLPSEEMSIADDRYLDTQSSLFGTMTFDIAAFEEVSTILFLKQSVQNILIYIGNQFNGYNRSYLCEYIQGRRSWLNHVGYVYKTPSNHLITEHMLNLMKYSDFTIFAYADPCIFGDKELYSMHFYTVKQWSLCTPGIYVSAEEELSDELPDHSPRLERMDGYESIDELEIII